MKDGDDVKCTLEVDVKVEEVRVVQLGLKASMTYEPGARVRGMIHAGGAWLLHVLVISPCQWHCGRMWVVLTLGHSHVVICASGWHGRASLRCVVGRPPCMSSSVSVA